MKSKKIASLFLASAMILSCAACTTAPAASKAESKTESKVSSEAAASEATSEVASTGEVVTLQMLSLTSNTSGLQENSWWTDLLKEKVGVQLELLPAGDQGEQKLQALMASGTLPDLLVFKDPKQVSNAVAGDMLLSFEDYKDIVPDLYENAAAALQYSADMLSEGKNKPFSIGIQIAKNAPIIGNINFAPRLRYDIYKQIGSPEIATATDYLTVLKAMQEASPTNADGKKVYAFSLWSDWDQSTAYVPATLMCLQGGDIPSESSLLYKDTLDNTVHSDIEEGGKYMEALKFFYNANQMGLLDPDSLTQRFEDAQQKFTDGRALFDFWTWGSGSFDNAENHANKVGFMTVAAKDARTLQQQLAPTGSMWSMAISSATKYPELCMKYINYMYSDEGYMNLSNGPQGVTWDVNAEGKPEVLPAGYQYITDTTKELPGGGKLADGIGVVNAAPYAGQNICETYGVPFAKEQWPTYKAEADALVDEWKTDMGAKDQIDYLTKNTTAGIVVSPYAPMPPVPDKMKQIEANAGSVIQQLSWKMIYAKDQAEYDALKTEMVDQAKAAGIEEYVTWYTAEFTKALATGEKYSGTK